MSTASKSRPPRATAERVTPRLRADAQKNQEAVVEAARAVFARSGVDAPMREIAGEAGVGLATIYRHFPTRADLIAAVFRREVDDCAEAAQSLAQGRSPIEALTAWLMRYTQFLASKQGLGAALHSGDPMYAPLPGYFRARFEPVLKGLLAAAAQAGEARTDVAAYDLLRAIGNLAAARGEDGAKHTERMVGLIVDGLRYRAAAGRG